MKILNLYPPRTALLARTLRGMIVFTALISFIGYAQPARTTETGTIQGRVLNATSGNYLNNARITDEGTTLQVFTNEFGQYLISGVPAGAVTLRLFYTGFEPQLVQLQVAAGQSVTRDFAFVVPDGLAADALVRAIRGADKGVITGARVFDRYQPQGGQLSLAIEVVLQPGEQSFTEAEIAEISKRIIAAAEKLGATLRS